MVFSCDEVDRQSGINAVRALRQRHCIVRTMLFPPLCRVALLGVASGGEGSKDGRSVAQLEARDFLDAVLHKRPVCRTKQCAVAGGSTQHTAVSECRSEAFRCLLLVPQ
jgi:hypothetical protein